MRRPFDRFAPPPLLIAQHDRGEGVAKADTRGWAGHGGPGVLTLRQFRYLVAVAEAESVSRAANQVGISRSAIASELQALEGETGAALLVCHRRGVRLSREDAQQARSCAKDHLDAPVVLPLSAFWSVDDLTGEVVRAFRRDPRAGGLSGDLFHGPHRRDRGSGSRCSRR